MTYGWTWRIWVSPTSTASWTPRSPRQASLATQWRALPSSSPSHRSGRTHSAPAAHCCHHPAAGCSPSARSSPRAPSCCPHLCSSVAPAAAFTPAAAWSWRQESGAARLCPCQAHEVPGQAAFLGRANPRHWALLFRRW